jgi:hypothetical protein
MTSNSYIYQFKKPVLVIWEHENDQINNHIKGKEIGETQHRILSETMVIICDLLVC